MSRKWFVFLLAGVVWLAAPVLAQQATASSKGKTRAGSASAPFTMKAYSRMVTLDVVVEDRKGHHITGLKAGDFQVYEQVPTQGKKEYIQKIAELREIHTAALERPEALPPNPEPGVYTNAIAAQQDTVPPTVLVVDGINTKFRYQAQVHDQMLKMLRQLPPNAPVAVILMGDRLTMLQGFTTDHELLQKALAKAESLEGHGLDNNPDYSPDAPSNLIFGLGYSPATAGHLGGLVASLIGFEKQVYQWKLEERILKTADAFMAIARNLAGYPGRKNLLWLSTSFPLKSYVPFNPGKSLHPGIDINSRIPAYMQILNNALSNAQVAVYPIDVGGVTTLQAFSAETMLGNPGPNPGSNAIAGANSKQIDEEYKEHLSMFDFAKGTGGKVCEGQNRIANCIRKAVNDSSDFYELSYYPHSGHWNGEYRRIVLKFKRRGAHLSYRRGYYATPAGNPDPKMQAAVMQRNCGDPLDATGILFTAKVEPPDAQGRPVFRLAIDPSELTFLPTPSGEQRLNLEVGVCTYNRRGWSQNLMAYPLNVGLSTKSYRALIDGGHLLDSIYVPGPKPSAVRVIVKDVPSGKMGSVYIRTAKTK